MPIRDPTNFNGNRPPGQNATVHPVFVTPVLPGGTICLRLHRAAFPAGGQVQDARPVPRRWLGGGGMFLHAIPSCPADVRAATSRGRSRPTCHIFFPAFLFSPRQRWMRFQRQTGTKIESKPESVPPLRGYMRAASRANDKPLVECPSPLLRQANTTQNTGYRHS
jgi:hypothetical protein